MYTKLSFLTLTLFVLPIVTFAQEYATRYEPLTGIPGINPNASTEDYINALFALSIGVAAALAVVRIIYSGVQYMLSDVITNKQSAKADIRNALIGLILILAAVTLLNEINPQLTRFDIFRNAPSVDVGIDNTIGSNIGDRLNNTRNTNQNRTFDSNCRAAGGYIQMDHQGARCVTRSSAAPATGEDSTFDPNDAI